MDCNSVMVANETIIDWSTFLVVLFGGAVTLVGIYLGSKLALREYFKKREHEQIMKRYLDEGLDLVMSRIEQSLAAFFNNRLRTSIIFEQIKEGSKVDISAFETFDRQLFAITNYSKIQRLAGDHIFEEIGALFVGAVKSHNILLDRYFQITIENGNQTRTLSPGFDVNKAEKHLVDAQNVIARFHSFFDELLEITTILEKQTHLTWDRLDNFQNQPEIKNVVKRVKKKYSEFVTTIRNEMKTEQNNEQVEEPNK